MHVVAKGVSKGTHGQNSILGVPQGGQGSARQDQCRTVWFCIPLVSRDGLVGLWPTWKDAMGCCCGSGELDANGMCAFGAACWHGGERIAVGMQGSHTRVTLTPILTEGIAASLGAKQILLLKSVQLQVKSKYDDFILVGAESHVVSLCI